MLGIDWFHRRRRADSTPARERIEPTLPPIDGRVRIRLRYNDRMACAITDNEAKLHGVSIADAWRDAMGEAPAREVVVDVPLPPFSAPGPTQISAEATPDAASIEAPPPPPTPERASIPLPTPPTPPPTRLQPTLSPAEHASRLLAWCRRRGLAGELTFDDILEAYRQMCRDEALPPRAWNPVSREFTLLVAGRVGVKHYANRNNVKVRVFRVAQSCGTHASGVTAPVPPTAHAAAPELERAAA